MFEILNVRNNEISEVSYLFIQKEVNRDIYVLENSKQTFIFNVFLNKTLSTRLFSRSY